MKVKEVAIISFLRCFSLTENISKIFEVRSGGDGGLNIFNGLRVICICWIIYGHEYNSKANNSSNLMFEFEGILSSTWTLIVMSAVYSVDVFFFMSGFFFTYTFLDKVKKMILNIFSYALIIFHRILRIWPSLLFILFMWWKISPHLATGPAANDLVLEETGHCDNKWYYNLLFIDNYKNTFATGYCVGWGWYLAIDM